MNASTSGGITSMTRTWSNEGGIFTTKIQAKVSYGLYIPKNILKQAGIDDDVEMDPGNQEIRIISSGRKKRLKKISTKSLFWSCVGSVDTPGINGRDHDRYLNEQ